MDNQISINNKLTIFIYHNIMNIRKTNKTYNSDYQTLYY